MTNSELTAMNLHVLFKIGFEQKPFITFQTFVIDVFVFIPMNIQLLFVNKALTALGALIPPIICKQKTKDSHKIFFSSFCSNFKRNYYFDVFACVSLESFLWYRLCYNIGTEISDHLHVHSDDISNERL